MRRPSLFGQSVSLFIVLIFALLSVCVISSYLLVVKPLVRASVRDLAALVTLSANTWAELPPTQRSTAIATARHRYQLDMAPARGKLLGRPSLLPYISMLDAALSARTGQRVYVLSCLDVPNCYVVDIPTAQGALRFRFSRDRIGTNPLLTLLIVFCVSAALSVIGAWYLARRVAHPLQSLATATSKLSRGDTGITLVEEGPRELAQLAGDFNRMTERLRELMQARTTLLAGVSHDLRTPIARLRMALELARREYDSELHNKMENYLADMNELIAQFLSYSRDTRSEPAEVCDAVSLLRQQTEPRAAENVILQAPKTCRVVLPPISLGRVVQNLVENALVHGDGFAVEVALDKTATQVVIEIRDRGPGIPDAARADAFKPFVRLDTSRNPAREGSGLGLAIVRQICDTYDWRVELLSRAGGGTVARLTLPIADDVALKDA